MKTADVQKHYERVAPGGRWSNAAAGALGISRQAVEQWGPTVPEGSAYKLESITAGALKANPKDYAKAHAA